uniref:Uncharacterized protein n=1 Tax=Acrobeloides nanus TaxID=290746 RepID=A0A914ELV9_9BILA
MCAARSESTQEETRASIATSSDSFTWWDNDYDHYRCEIAIEEAIRRFDRDNLSPHYRLHIRLCYENRTPVVKCRIRHKDRSLGLNNNRPKRNVLHCYCHCDNQCRCKPPQLLFPVPSCYGACQSLHRRSLELAINEMLEKWKTPDRLELVEPRQLRLFRDHCASDSFYSRFCHLCGQVKAYF